MIRSTIIDIYKKGFFHLFSANTLIHMIEFGSQFFVAWILLSEDVGRIKSFQVFFAIAGVLANMGFSTSILKLCANPKLSRNEKEDLFNTALILTFGVSIIVFLLIFILSYFSFLSSDPVTNDLFIYYALGIPFSALNVLITIYFQALKKFKEVSFLLVISRVFQILIIISLTYMFGIKGFISAIFLGYLLTFAILFFRLKVKININRLTLNSVKEHWQYAKFAFLGSLISTINLYLDILILNHLVVDKVQLGYFAFGLTLLAGLRIISNSSQQFLTPFYAEFSNNIEQLLKAFKKSNIIFISISTVIGIVAFFITEPIINFILKDKFAGSFIYFEFLLLAWLIRNLVSLVGPLFTGYGKVNVNFYNILITFILGVFPTWYLITNYDIMGAAYAQVINSIILVIVVIISFKNMFKRV